jgi:hypothetical protein
MDIIKLLHIEEKKELLHLYSFFMLRILCLWGRMKSIQFIKICHILRIDNLSYKLYYI